MTSDTAEYIIIGGGTTGCVVAARLAQTGASVVIVEAGYHVVGDDRVDIPGNFGKTLGDAALDWRFETTPQHGLSGRKVPLPRGKAVGGTSVINSMTWGRASKKEYNDISESLGNGGWGWDDLLPHFKSSETLVPPSAKQWALDHGATHDPRFHGQSGPLQRGFVPWLGDSHIPFFKALNNLGVPSNPDSCNGHNLGVFTLSTSIDPKTSRRCSSATAFYAPNSDKINLIDGAQVQRIVLASSNDASPLVATGVEYQKDGQVRTISASREVILCAGAYGTPKILELSGIGDSEHLKAIGVTPRVGLPGVGENLQDHLLVPTSFELKAGIITGDNLLDPAFATKELEAYKRTGEGQYASIHSAFSLLSVDQVLPSEKARKRLDVAHASIHVGDVRLQRGRKALYELQDKWFTDSSQGQFEFMHVPQFCAIAASSPKPNTTYLSILSLVMRPFSRGRVHAHSADPMSCPVIDPAYLSNEGDLHLLMDAVRFACNLAKTEPLASMIVAQSEPTPEVLNDDVALAEYIKVNLETAHHPIGTASMMPIEYGGVVGPDLRVYECTNLRVADASIIPIQLSTHPQATLYAIGEKGAALIIDGDKTAVKMTPARL